jgi:signal transduction histidine kinase
MKVPAELGSEAATDRPGDPLELRRLLAELTAAREAERAQIRARIHDDVIQSVTATGIWLGQLRHHLSDPGQIEIIDRLELSVGEAIAELRGLMTSLASAPADDSESKP